MWSDRYRPNYDRQDEIPSFYDEQMEKMDWNQYNPEIEKLKLQRDILKMQLELQNWDSLDYQDSIENVNNDIDFEIKWGWIEKTTYSLKHKWWIKFSKKESTKRYKLWYTQITPSNEWHNKYEIHLNTSRRWKEKVLKIQYNGWSTIHVFDQRWRYTQTVQIEKRKSRNNRRPTGVVKIEIYKWEIVLFLDLTKKQNNYHHRKNRKH